MEAHHWGLYRSLQEPICTLPYAEPGLGFGLQGFVVAMMRGRGVGEGISTEAIRCPVLGLFQPIQASSQKGKHENQGLLFTTPDSVGSKRTNVIQPLQAKLTAQLWGLGFRVQLGVGYYPRIMENQMETGALGLRG